MARLSPARQMLLPLFLDDGGAKTEAELLTKGRLRSTPEGRRKLRCRLAWVGRWLRAEGQMLLHFDDTYKVAEPCDSIRVEKYLERRRKAERTMTRTTKELLAICEKRKLLPPTVLAGLRRA